MPELARPPALGGRSEEGGADMSYSDALLTFVVALQIMQVFVLIDIDREA